MAYLNSDDLLLPGSLAYVARYFAAHPEVDVIYGQRVMVDEHDRQIGIWVLPPHDDEELALLDFVPQETLFWRRSAWEAAGAHVDASLSFAMDWDLLLRFRESGARIVRVPRFLGAFRVHEDQKTANWFDQALIECEALRLRVHGRPIFTRRGRRACHAVHAPPRPHFLWQRFLARLPLPRQPVGRCRWSRSSVRRPRTLPPHEWSRRGGTARRRRNRDRTPPNPSSSPRPGPARRLVVAAGAPEQLERCQRELAAVPCRDSVEPALLRSGEQPALVDQGKAVLHPALEAVIGVLVVLRELAQLADRSLPLELLPGAGGAGATR